MKRLKHLIEDSALAIAIALILLILSGCAHTQVEYRYVDLPEPPVIARPDLKTQSLRPGDAPADVIQAHRSDIVSLQSWGRQLEAALNGYRRENRPVSPPGN